MGVAMRPALQEALSRGMAACAQVVLLVVKSDLLTGGQRIPLAIHSAHLEFMHTPVDISQQDMIAPPCAGDGFAVNADNEAVALAQCRLCLYLE